MGEEKKEEEKKAEEGKKEAATENKGKEDKPAAAAAEEKPKADDKKSDGGEDDKASKDEPPPPEIVLRVYMHCEGCARKVRKCLQGFDGVEEVTTDCKTQKVVVKGEKADPLKVLGRLQKKTHRQVQLLSPIPKPPAEEDPKKPEEKEATPQPEENIQSQPKVITVVLKVHMHCEACSLEIKRRIEKMKEVEEAIPDLKNSEVTVKGTFEAQKLLDYVHKRTGKHATIVKQDPPPEKKEEDKGKDVKEEKKGDSGEGEKKGEEEKAEEGKVEKKEDGPSEGGAEDGKAAAEGSSAAAPEEGAKVVEFKRNEFMYYPPRYAMEMHAYPPQIFSDENPNACSVM